MGKDMEEEETEDEGDDGEVEEGSSNENCVGWTMKRRRGWRSRRRRRLMRRWMGRSRRGTGRRKGRTPTTEDFFSRANRRAQMQGSGTGKAKRAFR